MTMAPPAAKSDSGRPGPRARRRRNARPGLSLLAQGDPFVWLTGGALAFSVAMIIGLLTLVIWFGLGTFWPAPVVEVQTVDGTAYLGEITRDENFELTSGMADGYQPNTSEVAHGILGDAETVPAHRRLFRTGNFRITDSHFHWVEDFAVDRETRPEWAMVLERMEWGRFYGYPIAFVINHPRPISSEEERLVELTQLFTAGVLRLSPEQRAEIQPQVDQAGDAIAALNEDLAEIRRAATTEFLAQFEPEEGVRYDVVMVSGEITGLDEVPRDGVVAGVEEVMEGPDLAWKAYRSRFGNAEERRERARYLQKRRNGAIDDRREEARLAVREMELKFERFFLGIVNEILTLQTELDALAEETERLEGLAESFSPADPELASLTDLVDAITAGMQEQVEQQAARPRERREALEETLNELPDEVQNTIEDYFRTVSEGAERSESIKSEVEELQDENERLRLRLETVQLTRLFTITDLEYEGPENGKPLPESWRDAFSTYGHELPEESDRETCIVVDARPDVDWWQIDVESPGRGDRRYIVRRDEEEGNWSVWQPVVKDIDLEQITRAYPANRLGFFGKLSVYVSRWAEFLLDEPREANQEGGVFPAIMGTVVMTLIMALIVAPFGVLAALYLREYARGGLVVSAIRVAINNLAGVPSIVFGVFGLGFFCYLIGAYVDGGPNNAGLTPWPPAAWFLVMGALAVVGTAAFVGSVMANVSSRRSQSSRRRWVGMAATALWLVSLALFVMLLLKTPFFSGFHEARLPNPTFGKAGLLWASLTLALLTLPVVIVATEEALAAVPNSLREGSYAAGASKWQTIRRIVLPHALPGIMTGMILAMARGAGEVAPLMLVGAVKMTMDQPVDLSFPFVHADRSFMHLGFHIYDLGFQSQNAEAAKPMVFTTTLLLIGIIFALNIVAIALRSRLRRRFSASHF